MVNPGVSHGTWHWPEPVSCGGQHCPRGVAVTAVGPHLGSLQVASQLRFFDPQLKEKPEEELFVEPLWLAQLRQVEGQMKVRRAGGGPRAGI